MPPRERAGVRVPCNRSRRRFNHPGTPPRAEGGKSVSIITGGWPARASNPPSRFDTTREWSGGDCRAAGATSPFRAVGPGRTMIVRSSIEASSRARREDATGEIEGPTTSAPEAQGCRSMGLVLEWPWTGERAMSSGAVRLEMQHITKNFGGVHALRDVSLTAHAGEVHAICGENGAGKSTLMKILAGAITDYQGSITLDGRPVSFSGPRDAEAAGIRIIYQELNLVPDLTVAANIFLGRERTGLP